MTKESGSRIHAQVERQLGFTLVEVMVALGVLAFGILAIASMQTPSLGGTNTAREVTTATGIAMDRMETFASLSYGHSDLSDGSHGPAYDSTGRYTINWTVDQDAPIENTKTINVTVQWSEKGATKTSSLVFIKMDII
jgi:type IV pilus assembly protein PilV